MRISARGSAHQMAYVLAAIGRDRVTAVKLPQKATSENQRFRHAGPARLRCVGRFNSHGGGGGGEAGLSGAVYADGRPLHGGGKSPFTKNSAQGGNYTFVGGSGPSQTVLEIAG